MHGQQKRNPPQLLVVSENTVHYTKYPMDFLFSEMYSRIYWTVFLFLFTAVMGIRKEIQVINITRKYNY